MPYFLYGSLKAERPDLAEEWDFEKNNNLLPEEITPGSGKKVWWKCKKGHSWQTTPNNRTNKPVGQGGCPYCAGKKVCQDNSLAERNPEIAKLWHPTKNGDLTPADVTAGSSKEVWFLCEKGHEYRIPVFRHHVTGCGYCSGKLVCSDNSLAVLFPAIARQWHPTKNGDLTPADVTAGSKKMVWWKCELGEDHVWRTAVYNRTTSSGPTACPCCSGHQVAMSNCLATRLPQIAAQWHPTENRNLTPFMVTPYSRQSVWWYCPIHQVKWKSSVLSRTRHPEKVFGCTECVSIHRREVMLKRLESGYNSHKHRIAGWHSSEKAGRVWYRSGFEAKAYADLDSDESVLTYYTEPVRIHYKKPGNSHSHTVYMPDLLVVYNNGTQKYVEIKPKWAMKIPLVAAKLRAGKSYAKKQGVPFEVWTEADLFESPEQMRKWGRKMKEETSCA